MSAHRLPASLSKILGAVAEPIRRNQSERVGPKQTIIEYLELEGMKPHLDADGDICYSHRGLHFLVLFDRRDPEFVSIALPCIDTFNSDDEFTLVTLAALAVSSRTKLAKVIVHPHKRVWVSAEMLLASPTLIIPILVRATTTLIAAAADYRAAITALRLQSKR